MNEKKSLLTPEKAATFIPFLASSFVATLVILFFVLPQYYNSNKVNLELNGLIRKKNQLDNLKSEYKIINKKFNKLNKEKLSLTELITGKSQLDTLLAKLGEIGTKNNIEFTSIIPKKLSKFVAKNKKVKNNRKNKKQVSSEKDPLLVKGAKKYGYDLSFKTKLVDFLAFLRELEFQDNVILIDDINVKSMRQISKSIENNTKEMLEVNISVIFYGRS